MSHFGYQIILLYLAVCLIFICDGISNQRNNRRHEIESRKSPKKAGKLSNCLGHRCNDGTCIQNKFVCDGWKDCDSDESTCEEYRCRGMDFSKLTGFSCNPLTPDVTTEDECVPYYMFCDGKVQCSNGNDELYCDYFDADELYDILTTEK